MKKAYILLILGVWVAVLPYLGFPYLWKDILFTITGAGLIWVSFMLYKESRKKETGGEVFDNFSENSNFNENQTSVSQEQNNTQS